jgi:hypothetical protein
MYNYFFKFVKYFKHVWKQTFGIYWTDNDLSKKLLVFKK